MGRELVNEDTLRAYLETELHKFQECNRYQVRGITKLQTPDAEGSNWSPIITTGSSGRKPRDPCVEIAARVVAEAREKFNLT